MAQHTIKPKMLQPHIFYGKFQATTAEIFFVCSA